MFRRWISAALLAAAGFHAVAAENPEKVVRETFLKMSPNATVTAVVKSEVPGFYQVLVGSTVYFISGDGKYFINGNVFDINSRTDIAEKQIAAMRRGVLTKIQPSQEIVFAPPNPKYTVTVFTDVDCPYCRKFHQQIAEYNKLGIAVKYVFYPLPIHPGADKKAETVWCSADRKVAYTTAMNGDWDAPRAEPANKQPIGQAIADAMKDAPKAAVPAQAPPTKPASSYKELTCANPIEALTDIGRSMGVDGTPAIFTPEGDHLGGMIAPDQLVKKLDQLAQRAAELTAK